MRRIAVVGLGYVGFGFGRKASVIDSISQSDGSLLCVRGRLLGEFSQDEMSLM